MILATENYFFLYTKKTSYILRILPNGQLIHCYYGERFQDKNIDFYNLFLSHTATTHLCTGDVATSFDGAPLECSGFGRGDFRIPMISVASEDGRGVNEFQYQSYCIVKGKPIMPGLPQTDVNTENVETLEIVLKDSITNVEVVFSYTPFYEEDVIARHTKVHNVSEKAVTILSVASASVDFETSDFDMISLGGRWGSERNVERYPIHYGESTITSRRGMSGHHLNPFMALVSRDANETYGDVYGFSLVYSGDFKMVAEVGQLGTTRAWIGINPETFSWEIEPGDCFYTPEALITYSKQGLQEMSQNYHNVCRNHLGVCADKTIKRPVVLNLWESFEFDITEEIVLKAIEKAKEMGVDTLVVDDGWFGRRTNDKTSMGDWFVNREKFPNGLDSVAKACKKNGMEMGIWFEPEVISRESELFRTHPDWCIHIPNVSPVEIRNELMLDFGRSEVVEYVYQAMAKILSEVEISYVKWDMNRGITDNGATWLPSHRQKEHNHRFMLGVYQLMSRLRRDFPHIFFEGCASGGGRFDFGILYYMPQIWTSDNTDMLERMKIQYGTSLVYPPETISAHVSDCPNSISGRTVPFQSRCDVSQLFSYGYELNPMILLKEEKEASLVQSEKHRKIVKQYEDNKFYRLRNPFTDNSCAWQLISKDGKSSAAFYAVILKQSNYCGEYLKLMGLAEEKLYRVEPIGITCSGSMLMYAGIPLKIQLGDFSTQLLELTEVEHGEICVESNH